MRHSYNGFFVIFDCPIEYALLHLAECTDAICIDSNAPNQLRHLRYANHAIVASSSPMRQSWNGCLVVLNVPNRHWLLVLVRSSCRMGTCVTRGLIISNVPITHWLPRFFYVTTLCLPHPTSNNALIVVPKVPIANAIQSSMPTTQCSVIPNEQMQHPLLHHAKWGKALHNASSCWMKEGISRFLMMLNVPTGYQLSRPLECADEHRMSRQLQMCRCGVHCFFMLSAPMRYSAATNITIRNIASYS